MSDDEQRPTGVGAGLPEDAPTGMGMDPAEHAENDVADDAAPDTTSAPEGDPGQATGNPRAAGAEKGRSEDDA
ncbi:MAG TPA: hypothetical protein VGO80_21975 [Solirubrobacteraceae bacterium]|nr:hypothetical protein [Solirubrobacteraceae bacterium]